VSTYKISKCLNSDSKGKIYTYLAIEKNQKRITGDKFILKLFDLDERDPENIIADLKVIQGLKHEYIIPSLFSYTSVNEKNCLLVSRPYFDTPLNEAC
jgi:hypothetical protein